MGWLKLCDDDPLVKTMSQVFRANIIRVPEARLQPLSVLAARDGRLAYRGKLADLVAGEVVAELVTPAFETGTMADVSGKRSRKISVELGLDILKGFLSGFGVPAAAGLAEQFSGASEVSFSFSQVRRVYIDPARLGRLLAGRTLDRSNAVVSAFLQEDPWECLTLVLLGLRAGEAWLAEGTFEDHVHVLAGLDPESASLLAEHILELFGASPYRDVEGLEPLLQLLAGFPLVLDVVLPNLARQPPAAVFAALQQGVALEIGCSERKTESILRCIEYSHSNLSPDAQHLLACLAPFSGVLST